MSIPELGHTFAQIQARKIKSFEQARSLILTYKEHGISTILALGVFDLLHPGHLDYLTSARDAGRVLFVGVEPDEAVVLNKGEKRPIQPLEVRMEMLAGLHVVNYVFAFLDAIQYTGPDSYAAYVARYAQLSPTAVAVMTFDPNLEMKRKQAASAGIEVLVLSGDKDYSTTKLVQSIISK